MPSSEPATSEHDSQRSESSTLPQEPEKQESMVTVVVALVANGLLAAAKTVAAFISGSASMAAEAAHSWADTGNEVFLLIAERKGNKPRDASHPRGYGRATYVWSLVAAFGLFSAGAVVSMWHGVTELLKGEEGNPSYLTNYIVLAIALALEGSSFFQASRQVHGESQRFGLHPLRFVDQTSNPTLRAVFFEDSAALAGILLAGAGIGLHQLTGNAIWDGIGSIAVGVLLAFVAVYLMRRKMQYLVGEGLTDDLRSRVVRRILEHPEIDRVTYLHVEFVGPRKLFVVAAVDLVGDDEEGPLAVRLRGIEDELEGEQLIVDAVLTLSRPDEAAIEP
ncbi:MAG: cation diffusion facilitator family transporter [Marmoricola sp.]